MRELPRLREPQECCVAIEREQCGPRGCIRTSCSRRNAGLRLRKAIRLGASLRYDAGHFRIAECDARRDAVNSSDCPARIEHLADLWPVDPGLRPSASTNGECR